MLSLCAALQVGVVTSFDLEGNADPIQVGCHALMKVLMVLTEVGQPLFIEHNAATAAKELGVLPTIEQLDSDFLSCVHVDTLYSASHSPQGILGIFIEHSKTLCMARVSTKPQKTSAMVMSFGKMFVIMEDNRRGFFILVLK